MAREEKRPSGRKSFGDKSFGGKPASASGRSSSGSRNSSSKFKKEGDSSSRPKRTFSSDSSDKPKSYRGTGDFKKSFTGKSFGDKPSGDRPFGKKTYSDKPAGEYKPKREASGRSEGGFSSGPKREGGFKKDSEGSSRPRFGDKKPFGEKKSFGDKPAYGRKPYGTSKPFGDKTYGDKPKRSFGTGDKDGGAEKRSFGRKPFGEGDSKPRFDDKRTFGEKKKFGDKPSFGDKPKRSFGGRNNEDSGERRSFGRKPFGESSNDSGDERKKFGSKINDEDVEKRPFERRYADASAKKSDSDDQKPRLASKKSFDEKIKSGLGIDDKENFGSKRKSKSETGFKDFTFDKVKKSDDDFIASDFEKAAKYADKFTDDKPKSDKKRPSKLEFTESVSDSREGIRLNKYIANSGICSRREADVLISQGLVSVNGEAVTELGVIVKRNDVVKYDGRTLNPERNVYLLLNKPKDFITTTNDPQERKTVMNLVSNACKERIYPVGRLDRNTTGLLLFTNDGELAEKLTHPSHEVKKIYQVELDRPISPEEAQAILDGLYFEEGKAIVDSMAVLDESKKVVGIEIHIGWNRIVRRIFEAKGFEVVRLDRVLYAGLTKKDLPRGEWRFLTDKEVIALKYPSRT
ncbi:MAG: pseudouridine synthase [Cytophagales bacterium]